MPENAHSLVCRHLRDAGPEAWGYYLNGPMPGCLEGETGSVAKGLMPLAILMAPFDDETPDDGIVFYKLEVRDPRNGGEGNVAAIRYLPVLFTMSQEQVLDIARQKTMALLLDLEGRTREMRAEVGQG
jgi:hypothetical protein